MTKVVIPIKGNIISDEDADVYDYFGITGYTSPKKISTSLANAEDGDDVELQVASNGGDVFAASEIYTALKSSKLPVKASIQGLAASAASVVAMAADTVEMSPTAQMMIHKAWSVSQGNADDMQHEATVLSSIDDSIVNAYEAKTGMDKGKLLNLMSDETWMGAEDAVKLGFADAIMKFNDDDDDDDGGGDPEDSKLQAFASFGTIIPHDSIEKMRELMALEQKQKKQNTKENSQSSLMKAKLAILNGGN